MKRKAVVWLAVAVVLIFVAVAVHQWCENKPESVMDVAARIEKSMGDAYKKQVEMELFNVSSYTDEDGNKINYFILKTVLYDETEGNIPFETVIAAEKVNSSRETKVQDKNGRIYYLDHQAYLCWELSDGICGVLEYDPATVSDEEIIMMAKSVGK